MTVFDRQQVRRFANTIVEIAYPPRCSGCGLRGRWVCDECLRTMPLFAEPRCAICSMPLSSAASPCSCADLPEQVDRMWVAGPFDGWLRNAIHDFKFGGETARVQHLASLLVSSCLTLTPPAELVPIPLHHKRKRERGYEQTLLLAQEIAKSTGLPVFRGLKKSRHTPHQVGLDRSERSLNLLDAFELDAGVSPPAHAILVDDVMTTGSTLTECATTLRRGGTLDVTAVVIAHGL